jgi:transcriptional regulator with XRE-family HTH domain
VRVENNETLAQVAKTTERAFGERIRDFRSAHGWTQGDLAKRLTEGGLPMHQTTVAKMESASRPTSLGEAAALASLFEVPIERFLETPKEVWGHLQLAGIAHELASKATELAALEDRRRALVEEAEELEGRYASLAAAVAKAVGEASDG